MNKQEAHKFVDGVEQDKGKCGFMICAISDEDMRDNCSPEQYERFKALPQGKQAELLEDVADTLYALLEETDFSDAIEQQLRQHGMK